MNDDLFPEEQPDHVSSHFRALLEKLDRSSTRSTKNKEIERWFEDLSNWPVVGFKYVGKAGNLLNRVGEIQNRPDRPRHVVILVPPTIMASARRAAIKLIRDLKKYDAIGIAADGTPGTLPDLYHQAKLVVPAGLVGEFPTVKLHPV